jgi:hypothetical protein
VELVASQAELVLSSVGYFVIVGLLLSMAGIPSLGIELPNITTGTDQEDPGAHVDCIFGFQWFCDLGSFTIHVTLGIADALTYATAFLFFFFQLLTFQLPIPTWLNSIIVLPPAIVLMYVGIRFVRGGG